MKMARASRGSFSLEMRKFSSFRIGFFLNENVLFWLLWWLSRLELLHRKAEKDHSCNFFVCNVTFSFVLIGWLLPLIYFSSAAKNQKYCCSYSRQNALSKSSLKLHITTGMELPIPALVCIILMYPYACGRWARWALDEFVKRLCAFSWRIWGKRRGMSLACSCSLENCSVLITSSVPCDSFHLDQFNNLTDTNVYYWQHSTANMGAKDQAVCLLCFPYQQHGCQLGCISELLDAGMRMDCWWGKVGSWSFCGCRLNNMKYPVLICKPSKLRTRPVGE